MSFLNVFLAAALGLIIGYIARHFIAISRRGSIEAELEEKILESKKEIRKMEEEALARIGKDEENLREGKERLHKLEEKVEKRELELAGEFEKIRETKEKIEKEEKKLNDELEKLALISRDEARLMLINKIERESEEDLTSRMLKLSRDGEARLEEKAKDILLNSVYRLANSSNGNFFTNAVEIENEEIKGKIIGKEGRNIKTFERAAGVDLLVDEMPNAIVVSCFDSVRRAIAVNALKELIKDGRIQPAKIEECIEKSRRDIGVFVRKKGEEAILESQVLSVPDQIIPLLGRLYFRTSYGQDVLTHSIEMAHLAGMLAKELGADVYVARAGALLHDIGKAVDHEIEGTHVEIGRKILMKYGMDERVIKAMQAHHEEYPFETIESVIVQVADAISAGRPGARRDTVDKYLNRLQDLEALAMTFAGIEKVYAISAGREIRVFVTPTIVSDMEARTLAREIALRIEQELRYPGEIKVNVIRESRSIEFAR